MPTTNLALIISWLVGDAEVGKAFPTRLSPGHQTHKSEVNSLHSEFFTQIAFQWDIVLIVRAGEPEVKQRN